MRRSHGRRGPGWYASRRPVGLMLLCAAVLLVTGGLSLLFTTSARASAAVTSTRMGLERIGLGSRGDARKRGNTAEDAQDVANAAAGILSDGGSCRVQPHAEYAGVVVKWGEKHHTPTAEACCAACQALTGERPCNVWVWCAEPGGCGAGRLHTECWLKYQELPAAAAQRPAAAGPAVGWTSGALYDASAAAAAAAVLAAEDAAAAERRSSGPRVFFDIEIDGKAAGRIVFALYDQAAPRAAENFRALATGEKGVAPAGAEGAGKPYHFKGAVFYRIIDRFIDQTGVGTDSVYGGMFKDDPGGLKLKHDRKGLLSMANMGPDTNTSHFSIVMAPAPHLDGSYTIFGEVVEGMAVAEAINKLASADGVAPPRGEAKIVNSGQLS